MKVKLNEIKQSGLEINDKLDLNKLNDRMNESKANDITFTEEPQYVVKITPEGSGFRIEGSITGTYQQPCSLCLIDLKRVISSEFSYFLKKSHATEAIDDTIFYNDENYQIDELLEEELIIKTSPYLRPEDVEHECKTFGIITLDEPESKKDTFKLGDLLKKVVQ